MSKLLIEVSGVQREVSVKRNPGQDALYGKVGAASFYWEFKQYEYPMIRTRKDAITTMTKQEVQRAARAFIIAYVHKIRQMRETKSTTPIHVNPIDRTDAYLEKQSSSSEPSNTVSGIPLWMKEKCKVWVACYSRTTGEFLYYRRTRFASDEQILDMVKKFLPFCSVCAYRSSCDKPCDTPEVNSKQDMMD